MRSPRAAGVGEIVGGGDRAGSRKKCLSTQDRRLAGSGAGADEPRQFVPPAGRSSKFAVATPLEPTVTDCVAVGKRGAQAVALYVPCGTFPMTYVPSAPTLPKYVDGMTSR